MTQYYTDVLHQPTSGMDVPDLQAMAKDNDPAATLAMCRLTIAIAVQSARNKEIIDKIQALSQEDQSVKEGNDIGAGLVDGEDHCSIVSLCKGD